MLGTTVDAWSREAPLTVEAARTLHDLNVGFLGLEGIGLPRFVHLPAGCKAAIADCPYGLFDLGFDDDAYWQSRLGVLPFDRVAESTPVDAGGLNFARLALFYGWHLASSAGLRARLILGMGDRTARALADVPVARLSALAPIEALRVRPRWQACAAFWDGLADAAERADRARLRRIQLYGLQLAVAMRLP